MTTKTIQLHRSPLNPLIMPRDVKPSHSDWEVMGVFNAGVAQYNDEIILLLRVAERPLQVDPDTLIVPLLASDDRSEDHRSLMRTVKLDRNEPSLDFSDPRVVRDPDGKTIYLTSISHLRIARSKDGERFTVDDHPTIMPEGRMESWGIEDPRVTLLDGTYYIPYSAVSEKGVSVGLLSTIDFVTFRRDGLILAPTNKDVVLFPERVDGLYYMLHRPVPDSIGQPEMWIAQSPDLLHWGNHRFLMGLRDSDARIGAGCIPIKTDEGWLILYHGADRQHRYYMSAALLDLKRPEQVIARLDEPLMIPEADYEKNGFFQSVVFACGAIVKDGQVIMYYGAADDSMASVSFELAALLDRLKPNERKE